MQSCFLAWSSARRSVQRNCRTCGVEIVSADSGFGGFGKMMECAHEDGFRVEQGLGGKTYVVCDDCGYRALDVGGSTLCLHNKGWRTETDAMGNEVEVCVTCELRRTKTKRKEVCDACCERLADSVLK